MKTVKFAQVLKFSENLVKVDKPEEERYVTVLLYGRGVIEREIKEGKVPVAFTGYKAHAGQLIISTINARNGAAGIIPAELDGAVVSKDFPLFDIDHECVDEQYLLYYLWSDSFIHKAEQNSFGATMPRLHVKPFLNMQMRLPALSEQKRRTHTLCHVESLLNTQSHLLTKLDELVKSRFVELFKACKDYKRLEEHAALITKGASPKWQGVDYCEKGTLFVTSENVRECYLDLSKRKYLDDKINEIQPRSILKRNDILINIVGASIGRAAVYDCDELANINQAVALVRVDFSRINQTYLMTFLNSQQAIEMYGKMKKGGARDNLSLQNIADLKIPVAPMERQKEFAAFVAEVDKSKLAVKQSLEKLETLKKSLMQQYFG